MNVPRGRSRPSAPAELLREVVALSHRFGADPEFSRGGGGNSSVKTDGVLFIKPSGVSLATLRADTLIALDIETLLAMLASGSGAEAAPGSEEVLRAAQAARLGPPDDRRPSVELLFHALLPERFVLHTHPTTVNALCCAHDGRRLAARFFGDRVLWVPYVDPGLPLALEIADRRRAAEARTGRPVPRVLLLQNHGLVVAADSAQEVSALSNWIVDTIGEQVRCRDQGVSTSRVEPLAPAEARATVDEMGPSLRGLLASGRRLRVVTFDDSPLAVELANSDVGRALVLGGPLTPDQIVYAGSWPLLVDPGRTADRRDVVRRLRGLVTEHVRNREGPPSIVVVPGLGLFAAADSYRLAETARQVMLDAMGIALGADRFGGIRALSSRQRRFIEEWEAEAYRRGVEAGASASGRAHGLVVVVVGATRGFGPAIAADLVAEGAHVVLAGPDIEEAESDARGLTGRFGSGRAMALSLDDADERSIADGFHAVIRWFGGFDLLVWNADDSGKLRAAGQSVGGVEPAARVGDRRFELCLRHAAPVLALQQRARPGFRGGAIAVTTVREPSATRSALDADRGLSGDVRPAWSPVDDLGVENVTTDEAERIWEARVLVDRGHDPREFLEAFYDLLARLIDAGRALPEADRRTLRAE